MRQPIEEINAALLEDAASWDGAVEPLQIRDVATRRVHPNDITHKFWAALGEGNVAGRRGSDVFVTIVKNSDVSRGDFPMVDNSDYFGDVKMVSESISVDGRQRSPFVENYTKKGVVTSSSMEDNMLVSLNNMNPGTENLVAIGYSQLGASGFVY